MSASGFKTVKDEEKIPFSSTELTEPFELWDVFFWGTQRGNNYTHRNVPTPPSTKKQPHG